MPPHALLPPGNVPTCLVLPLSSLSILRKATDEPPIDSGSNVIAWMLRALEMRRTFHRSPNSHVWKNGAKLLFSTMRRDFRWTPPLFLMWAPPQISNLIISFPKPLPPPLLLPRFLPLLHSAPVRLNSSALSSPPTGGAACKKTWRRRRRTVALVAALLLSPFSLHLPWRHGGGWPRWQRPRGGGGDEQAEAGALPPLHPRPRRGCAELAGGADGVDLTVGVGGDRRWSGLKEAAVKLLLLLRTGQGGLERRKTMRLTARNRDNNEVRSQIRRRWCRQIRPALF